MKNLMYVVVCRAYVFHTNTRILFRARVQSPHLVSALLTWTLQGKRACACMHAKNCSVEPWPEFLGSTYLVPPCDGGICANISR